MTKSSPTLVLSHHIVLVTIIPHISITQHYQCIYSGLARMNHTSGTQNRPVITQSVSNKENPKQTLASRNPLQCWSSHWIIKININVLWVVFTGMSELQLVRSCKRFSLSLCLLETNHSLQQLTDLTITARSYLNWFSDFLGFPAHLDIISRWYSFWITEIPTSREQ